MLGSDGNSRYIVAWAKNRTRQFTVDYTLADPVETIKCTCNRMHRKELPCKHILFSLNHRELSRIHECCVLRRFSKKARFGLPARRESDMFEWGWPGVLERKMHIQLSVVAGDAFNVACNDENSYNEIMECMQRVISRTTGLENGSSTDVTYAMIMDKTTYVIHYTIQQKDPQSRTREIQTAITIHD